MTNTLDLVASGIFNVAGASFKDGYFFIQRAGYAIPGATILCARGKAFSLKR
jgi:hypothetical protein